MTDRERFIGFLEAAGYVEDVEFTGGGGPLGKKYAVAADDNGTCVSLGNMGGEGYCLFFSDWSFDGDGNLVSVGHWE
jgi:hypothetical protein